MADTTYPLEARFSVSQVSAYGSLLYPCETMTKGWPVPHGGASRTAIPGTEKCAGGAGGSEGRLAVYTTRGAPERGCAGYQRSTLSARSTRGADPLAASNASTSICPCWTRCRVLSPTAWSPRRASSGASTPGRLGGSSANAGAAQE